MNRLLRIFVTGLLAALPLLATVLVLAWAVRLLYAWLGPQSVVGRAFTAIGLGVTGSEIAGYASAWGSSPARCTASACCSTEAAARSRPHRRSPCGRGGREVGERIIHGAQPSSGGFHPGAVSRR
jgi:hypothetical protein